jgi:1-acyl-sn-glycerol-3-phosphate acyltransferase
MLAPMLLVRSLLFNVAFYLNLLLWMLVFLPTLLMPRKVLLRAAQGWGASSVWLLRVLVGMRIEIRGRERIPPGGLLVAAKHQSVLETFALLPLFEDPAFILKRELLWIPLFGWLAWKAGMVPINRSGGTPALAAMNRRARAEIAAGRQILIFPEGTRRAAGAPPAYKFGVAHLYRAFGVPCLPVALNSGLYWPRRQFIRRPGTVIIEILDPIPPGLQRDAFLRELQGRLEGASSRLLDEGLADLGPTDALAGVASPR